MEKLFFFNSLSYFIGFNYDIIFSTFLYLSKNDKIYAFKDLSNISKSIYCIFMDSNYLLVWFLMYYSAQVLLLLKKKNKEF